MIQLDPEIYIKWTTVVSLAVQGPLTMRLAGDKLLFYLRGKRIGEMEVSVFDALKPTEILKQIGVQHREIRTQL